VSNQGEAGVSRWVLRLASFYVVAVGLFAPPEQAHASWSECDVGGSGSSSCTISGTCSVSCTGALYACCNFEGACTCEEYT
jgi:hypothetical protein